MHARVSTYEGPPGQTDEEVEEITRRQEEGVLPTVRQLDGFKGVIALLDRNTGKALSITLWESEQAMRGSEEAANATRAQAAEIASEKIGNIERFEVTLWEMA